LHLPKEENPFLGVRGARLLLRPDLLDPQLRALSRGQGGRSVDHVPDDLGRRTGGLARTVRGDPVRWTPRSCRSAS
jgi:hypothetical protein